MPDVPCLSSAPILHSSHAKSKLRLPPISTPVQLLLLRDCTDHGSVRDLPQLYPDRSNESQYSNKYDGRQPNGARYFLTFSCPCAAVVKAHSLSAANLAISNLRHFRKRFAAFS